MSWALLAGSLASVLALAGIARMLGLGGGVITDAAEAVREAEAAFPGFDAADAQVDRDGMTALVRGADGSAVVLKVAGARIAARHLKPPVEAHEANGTIMVETGDRWFGRILIRPS